MPLSARQDELKKTVLISTFASVAVVLGILEALIPFTVSLPGAKLGLANIMVLTCLIIFDGKAALTLIMLKTILTSFILGTFSTFLFSFFGALFSFTVMYLMIKIGRNQFSIVGVSIAGGITHNLGQLLAASLVLGTTKIFYYFPFLLFTGIVTGVFVGLAAKYVTSAMERIKLLEAFGMKMKS